MRRATILISGWLAATTLAGVVAWQGVGFVGREVTDSRPAALSAAEVQAELRAREETGAVPTETSAPPEATVPGGAATPSPTGVVAPPSTRAPTPTTRPPGPGATTTSPTGTVRPTPTTLGESPPASTTTAPPRPSAETRTYNTVGGSAAIRFEEGRVTVIWATPNSGFDVDVEQSSPSDLRVRFRSENHESRINAEWENGAPRDRIEERSD